METLLGILVFAAFLAAQIGAVIAVQGGGPGHGPDASDEQAPRGQAARRLKTRGTGVAVAALLLSTTACAQDLNSVAQRFLDRHGVPCRSVLKVGSPQELGEVATCEDGREWALFWLEDEIAFIQPGTREAYRWDREIYLSYPELYAGPNDQNRVLASHNPRNWGTDDALSSMDRAIVEDHLRQAKEHVAKGSEHIRRRRQIIAELEQDGHDTKMARELLQTFEAMQAAHVADVDRLMTELAQLR